MSSASELVEMLRARRRELEAVEVRRREAAELEAARELSDMILPRDRGRAVKLVLSQAAAGDPDAIARLGELRRLLPDLPAVPPPASPDVPPMNDPAPAGSAAPAEKKRMDAHGWFAPLHSASVPAPIEPAGAPEAPEGPPVSAADEAPVVAPSAAGRMGAAGARDEAMPDELDGRYAKSKFKPAAEVAADYFATAPVTLGMREGETPRQFKVRRWRNRMIGQEAERVFARSRLPDHARNGQWMRARPR